MFSKRKLLFAGMVGLLCVGFGTSLTNNTNTRSSLAVSCNHNGNHYEGIAATETTSGTHEYWVCCVCHDHFLHKPDHGTWIDAGVATAINEKDDDRYIYPLTKPDQSGFTYERLEDDSLKVVGYTGNEKDVVIPENVVEIDSNVFKGNNTIETVEITNNVNKINESAFENCTKLKEIEIGNNIEIIEKNAFKNCDNLTSIVLPNSVTYIGTGAFSECENLESIVIPSSVTTLGKDALLISQDRYLIINGRTEVVIYSEMPNANAATQAYGKDWNVVGSKSLFGSGLFASKVYATVYYANQWHYDDNGQPVKN